MLCEKFPFYISIHFDLKKLIFNPNFDLSNLQVHEESSLKLSVDVKVANQFFSPLFSREAIFIAQ